MAITVQMRTEISQLYVALFGRAPDAEGLSFWVGLRDQGQSLTQIANAMYATEPARAYYPGFLTNEEIIASFYLNVLGRPADAEGLAYWTAKLNATGATPGSVISEMIDVVANYVTYGGSDPAGLTSAALFNNKTTVAQYYGEHAGSIEGATVVLASVTADPATVTSTIAAIDGGVIGQNGISVALTTSSDQVNGTVAVDTVTGVFGAADATLTAGDVIDLGAGTLDALNLVANGALASPAVIIKNTELINIIDTVGATFNALLVENAPAINFTNTQTGLTSMVTNGATGSTYGLAGKGNLTVDFASTSGAADVAKVSVNGAGTSSAATSTINVADGNTVEGVSIATAGTNFITLNGGTAAKTLTITGSGTNTWVLSSGTALAAVSTIDASAATGTNTFSLGGNVNSTDVIKGGTGTDTVSATFAIATPVKPVMTGVETLKADFDAAATLDLSSTDGLKTVTLAGFAVDATIVKADSTLSTVNIATQDFTDAVADNVTVGYATGAGGPLTVTLGDTSTSATDVTLGDLTVNGSTAFTFTTQGTKVLDVSNIDVTGDQSAVTINANNDIAFSQVAVAGDIGTVTINVADDVVYSGGISGGGSIGDVVYNVGEGASGQAWISSRGDLGSLTITGEGDTNMGVAVSGGNVGNVTVNLTGDDASGSYLGMLVSGGSIGNISVSLDDGANMFMGISANSFDFPDTDEDGTDGNVGNIAISIGNDSYISANVEASGGDIGDITVTAWGDTASGNLDFYASMISGDIDGDTDMDYVRGGNVGDVTVSVTGEDANINMDVLASGGNVGDVSFSITGDGGSGWLGIRAQQATGASGSIGGNVGNVTFTLGAGVSGEMGVNFDETIGSVTISVGEDSSGWIGFSGGTSGNAVMSDVNATVAADGALTVSVSGLGGEAGVITMVGEDAAQVYANMSQVSGSVGGAVVSTGDQGEAGARYSGNSGDIGSTSVDVGDGSSGFVYFGNNDAALGDVTMTGGLGSDLQVTYAGSQTDAGFVTLAGGDSSSSAGILATGTLDSHAGVDASAWAGDLHINLMNVTAGTTIQTGTGSSVVEATEGSDVIVLGSGVDTTQFDASPTAIDQLFGFAKAKDILGFDAWADITDNTAAIAVADNAAAGTVVDGSVYVFADGSNTTTGETIVSFTDETDVAAFIAAAFSDEAAADEFIAVINTGGGSAYVYAVDVDLGAGGTTIDAAAVTLIGVVAADGALTIANIST